MQNFQWMTDREIYDSWRLSKNRNYQLGILSQLNLMTVNEIRQVVKEQAALDKQNMDQLKKMKKEQNKRQETVFGHGALKAPAKDVFKTITV